MSGSTALTGAPTFRPSGPSRMALVPVSAGGNDGAWFWTAGVPVTTGRRPWALADPIASTHLYVVGVIVGEAGDPGRQVAIAAAPHVAELPPVARVVLAVASLTLRS